MKTAVIGGGILGLTLAYRLAKAGVEVELFEASPELGGLAATHDYGPFHWDRFYHVILPTDRHLIGLIEELGLGSELRWKKTRTGLYTGGRIYEMSGNADFLRFPLLSPLDKARLAATVVYAGRFADPWPLYQVTAEEWLTRWCGRRGYESFWKPLLRAKFGAYHDQVAAVFIWATLKRLFGARSALAQRESMGYVRGGYRTILGALRSTLEERGAVLRLGTPVLSISPAPGGCEVGWANQSARYDQVYFTGPTRLARKVISAELQPYLAQFERDNPAGETYLGVVCLVIALRQPLMPHYVLNVADDGIEATGVIGMTNLVDRVENTAGLELYYVPQYLDSDDERLASSDEALTASLLDRGVQRAFPAVRAAELAYRGIHRARHVQPLPLVRPAATRRPDLRMTSDPFRILNTSMLSCATLNNNEVLGLVDDAVSRRLPLIDSHLFVGKNGGRQDAQ